MKLKTFTLQRILLRKLKVNSYWEKVVTKRKSAKDLDQE